MYYNHSDHPIKLNTRVVSILPWVFTDLDIDLLAPLHHLQRRKDYQKLIVPCNRIRRVDVQTAAQELHVDSRVSQPRHHKPKPC